MFKFDTMIDTIQNVNKQLVEKMPFADELKKNINEGLEIQSVLVKSWLVHSEKTYKTMTESFWKKGF
jgi:hypothetical protein